jgi:hypothetical protein
MTSNEGRFYTVKGRGEDAWTRDYPKEDIFRFGTISPRIDLEF